MSGALAERVFVDKLHRAGFASTEVLDRQDFGLADAELYPLFTPDLIELMRRLLEPEQRVAVALTVSASKPG